MKIFKPIPYLVNFRKLRFFWQLLIAFALIAILAGGGIFLAGRFVLERSGIWRVPIPVTTVDYCATQLGTYYERHRSWEGAEHILHDTPCAFVVQAGMSASHSDYALAAPDGRIIVSSDGSMLGQLLAQRQLALSVPIFLQDEEVGVLFIPPFGEFSVDIVAAQETTGYRFLIAGLVIGALTLVVSMGFSQLMSRPLARLTQAAHAVAEGDLTTRVPTRYPGEVGELAAAFNQMTAALSRADELRRNMTADVAHELRTPLSVIRGKLEGVLDGVYPATPEHLNPILEETWLLTRLVDDLQLLALAEAGQLSLEKYAFNIGDLLHDTQVNFTPRAADQGVTLVIECPPGLPMVMADWRRIAQVLGNLVTNALRYTAKGGCITLSAAAAEECVEIAVTDTGTGIAPEDLPYVFERFWRSDKSRSRAGDALKAGSGLGLAIARQLVEAHGGAIRIESVPGKGAAVRFTLPALLPLNDQKITFSEASRCR